MRPTVPPELTTGPFRSATAGKLGLSPRQLQSAPWRRVTRDSYVWAGLPDTPGLRAAAVALVLPPGVVVSGRTAAWIWGVDLRSRPWEPTEATAPRISTLGLRGGVIIRRAAMSDCDVVVVAGIPLTSPLRTAFDLARRPDLVTGVIALDALLHLRLIDAEELRDYIDEHPRWRGVRVAARALALSEPKAESPGETRLRLVLVAGGLPRPEAQIELYDPDGGFVARTDLGYREQQLGVEYDGAQHRDSLAEDMRRQNAIFALGWGLRRYTGWYVEHRPALIVAQVAHALGLRS